MSVLDPPSLRRAIVAYEQAVALDSSFVLAWAQLARAQAVLYFSTGLRPGRGRSGPTGRRAGVGARPDRPEGHQALATYYSSVLRDHPRALTEDSTGARPGS